MPTHYRTRCLSPAGREKLRGSERELRRNPSTDVVIRAARAARTIYQYQRLDKILKRAEGKGVALDDDGNRALWQEWKRDCAKYKRQTLVNDSALKSLFLRVIGEEESVDHATIADSVFSNLNVMQCAAFNGDVQFLERAIRLGASLDYTHDEPLEAPDRGAAVRKPPDGTPLLLAVYGASCRRRFLELKSGEVWRAVFEGAVECAIQLVRLGANASACLRVRVNA